MKKQITKKDLPRLVTSDDWKGPIPYLYCPVCRTEASANAGDYWFLEDEHVFTCSENCCFEPLALVTKRTIIEDWKP